MARKLILNCDDFGQSPAANEAILHLLEERKVSSATIMTPAPAFEEAAARVRERGYANVGLHLTFTSEYDAIRWRSLTGNPSLHDESGHMYRTVEEFERGADPKAVRLEMAAQFEAVKQAGLAISHVDNHMGSLYGVATGRSYLPLTLWECSKRKLPFRLFRGLYEKDAFMASIDGPGTRKTLAQVVALADLLGVGLPDYLLSHSYHLEEGETYESFRAMMIAKLYDLPDGISETYIHPAAEDEELAGRVRSWEKRVWEYRLPLDNDFNYALRDAGVELVDYRFVQQSRPRSRLKAAARLAKALLQR
ncbi:polysaccharide deacetylase family protein [Cohnella sp. AR92]|uniref:polysaccharide deacetylase family protein n=1 Tax=Cohnella sp. AR92 TaxID=648716 RepID=UPI000F8DAFC1|nr:polysaccharide deacetylase family protein [Cohnella sp. AR92]RUS48836.1 ChbG/HpnK family deacetylase [Cohnella sp. AR92]